MTQRFTFAKICRSLCAMAAVYFLFMGFNAGFDVFGWYGVGWSRSDWVIFVLLTSLVATILLAEWWSHRKQSQKKAGG